MKIRHILEGDVVDFGSAQRKKTRADSKTRLTNTAEKFKKFQEYEQYADEEFIHFSKALGELKDKIRLFGFESVDDVFYFLTVDAKLPNAQSTSEVRKWYDKLDQRDKKGFLTIVQNSDKIMKVLKTVQSELRRFQDRWTEISKKEDFLTSLNVFNSTSFLDVETKRNIETLQQVDDIATALDS